MENVRRNVGEGVGLNLNHRKKMSHRELSPFSFFISIPGPFLPVRGGAGRNYRNAAGVFPTFAPV